MSIKQKWKMDKAKCTCWPGEAAVSQANNVRFDLILISPKKILKLKKLRNHPYVDDFQRGGMNL